MNDYSEFLRSLSVLFKAAVQAEDWKLALQIKTLEAKCCGFLDRKSPERKSISMASNEELARMLEELGE